MFKKNLILIEDKLDEFYLQQDNNDIEDYDYKQKINSPKNSITIKKNVSGIIEYINEEEYDIKEQEIKYKIFEDISAVTKNVNSIELIITLPKINQITSINKIRFSKNINNYIKDIYVTQNNKKIFEKEELLNSKSEKNNIRYPSNKQINLHLIIEPVGLNTIINKNIYISYSYITLKNKIKYYSH
jgi:hypothetical protein